MRRRRGIPTRRCNTTRCWRLHNRGNALPRILKPNTKQNVITGMINTIVPSGRPKCPYWKIYTSRPNVAPSPRIFIKMAFKGIKIERNAIIKIMNVDTIMMAIAMSTLLAISSKTSWLNLACPDNAKSTPKSLYHRQNLSLINYFLFRNNIPLKNSQFYL